MPRKLYLALAFIAYPFLAAGINKLLVLIGVPYSIMETISMWIMIPWLIIFVGGFFLLRARFFGLIFGPLLPWNWGKSRETEATYTREDIDRFSR